MSLSNALIEKIRNDAVDFAVKIANDNTHGYSQAVRSLYNIDSPKSFDCSSLVCTAYYYAFVKNGLKKEAEYLKRNCSYTGNMLKMLNCGFEVVAQNQTAHAYMIAGDIELNTSYHTALAISRDDIVHARSSEGTTDTVDGSGEEIRTQKWYRYSKGWTHRLRFTGKGIDQAEDGAPEQKQEETREVKAKDAAGNFEVAVAGTYVCHASELNVRSGAGTDKEILTSIKYGTEVKCYGYYTKLNGTKWLYIQFVQNGVKYTGFASEGATGGYLKKKPK